MTNKCKCGILISKTPYEKRYAIMEDGELVELIVDGGSATQILGNIYKGIVKKVLAGKLAFIDIGLDADGVLLQEDAVDRSAPRGKFDREDVAVSIEKVLRAGDEVMVQVSAEPEGKKGAGLTMNLNLAGTLLVCMPGTDLIRVSKRERDQGRRADIKRFINHAKARDVGYIVRTEGVNASEVELTQEMRGLETKWEGIKENYANLNGAGLIYEESSSTKRAIGEYINENTDYVYIDNRDEYFAVRDDLKSFSPDKLDKVKLWSSAESLFEYFKVENDYARSLQRTVPLPRGGNLVIEQTAALVSIDVNTGPKVHGKDQGKIILETNIDACREIAKQLRLRDVDGLTIVDFIDMETEADNTTVYNEFCKAIRRDKAEVTPATISQFGLMEIKRKRVHVEPVGGKTHVCPVCSGGGRTATLESTLGMIDRWMARASAKGNMNQVTLVTNPFVVDVLAKDRSRMFNYLEYKHGMTIDLIQDENAHVNQFWMYNENKEDITDQYNFADVEKVEKPAKPKAPKQPGQKRNRRDNRNKAKREILISKTPYEKRIAIMEDGELVELVVEGVSSNRVLGNIYKGVVQKVLPALKAAFIDIGMEKAGFLHQEDAMDRAELLRREYGDDDDEGGSAKEIPIDQILKEGQEIMVQVVKEPISTKGARLTTHLSFAGRFLVCMPGTNFIGVSKRERDPAKRREFKKVVRRLKGRDVGYIVRTNGLNESEFEINKQMRELEAKWEETKFNFENQPAETCIYEESDSIEQTVREYFSDNTDVVYIDNRDEYFALRDYLQRLSPDKLNKVKLWNEDVSLFENFKIENDYARSLQRKVPLSSDGKPLGWLILEQTEALVSIKVDVPEMTNNCAAVVCQEIAKQLRLRDVGGLIIIKFPEFADESVRETVYTEFRKAIRRDKAPISPSPVSQFGLMEVTRKRVRVNLMTEKTEVCSVCCGGGRIGTINGTLGMIDRWMSRAHNKGRLRDVTLVVNPAVVDELCKNDCNIYRYLESKHFIKINLVEDSHAHVNQYWMYDKNNEDITELYNFA
ncbi:Rne/Rng family ribonuclease [Fibrobacter sp. UWEL]|uniref:Rne/Rng family ribonuclease n=1 Tax=Fibrobacter sp. UWEL TaxID=1896209 RepID=UPI0009114F04|nr:Rne/Rng family ribonuclease [Fibrobacter sp. UWEL]SHK96944.1 ribonuclease, Rne/Rng family [Fibrobacter sp. UWEL]